MAANSGIPQLQGDAWEAAHHRGSHLQIIDSAGSGKTEAVSQRIALLLADGGPPDSTVEGPYTQRGAGERRPRTPHRGAGGGAASGRARRGPAVGGGWGVSCVRGVGLPDPVGPSRPTISPWLTSRSMDRTASTGPVLVLKERLSPRA